MAKVERNYNTLNDIKKKMSLGINKTGFYLETKMKKAAQWEAYDTWDYIRSFYSKMKWKYTVEVGNTKEYSWIIDYGRKPWKYPPFDALVWWVARKFSLKWVTKSYTTSSPEVKSKVFMVARAIKNKGIKPKEIIQKTYDKEKGKLQDIFRSVFTWY